MNDDQFTLKCIVTSTSLSSVYHVAPFSIFTARLLHCVVMFLVPTFTKFFLQNLPYPPSSVPVLPSPLDVRWKCQIDVFYSGFTSFFCGIRAPVVTLKSSRCCGVEFDGFPCCVDLVGLDSVVKQPLPLLSLSLSCAHHNSVIVNM